MLGLSRAGRRITSAICSITKQVIVAASTPASFHTPVQNAKGATPPHSAGLGLPAKEAGPSHPEEGGRNKQDVHCH